MTFNRLCTLELLVSCGGGGGVLVVKFDLRVLNWSKSFPLSLIFVLEPS